MKLHNFTRRGVVTRYPRHRRNRGFIFFMAILMIAFVGAAMLAMSTSVSTDAKRTLRQSNETQLDQMLLAGAAEAQARLNVSAPTAGVNWDVELPAALAAQPASLTTAVISTDATQAIVRISAKFVSDAATQTVHFRRDPEGWKLVSAAIN